MRETENIVTDLAGVQPMVTLVQFAQCATKKLLTPLYPLVDICTAEQSADLLLGAQDTSAVLAVQADDDDAARPRNPRQVAKATQRITGMVQDAHRITVVKIIVR